MAKNTVLVTGVSRGIGAAIAGRCLRDGYDVVGVSRTRVDGFGGIHESVDLSDASAKEKLAELAEVHRPQRLVANAGIALAGTIDSVSDGDFEAMMRVNVLSIVWAMQAVIPHMREAGFGRIVVIGSRASLGKQGRIGYGSSKAALNGLVRTSALELAGDGITVNIVAPGPIETEMFAAHQPVGTPARDAIERAIPAGRVGQPGEVAHAVSSFLDDDAGFTTGQALFVCGGMTIGAY